MGLRKSLKLGDKVEKVINAVVPKKFIPKDCGCGARRDWLNGMSRQERLAQLQAEADAKKNGN